MPFLSDSSYPGQPFYQLNGFFQTVMPAMFRKIDWRYEGAKKIDLPDGDFIDYCYKFQASRRLVVLTHGLEGNAFRPYVTGTAAYFYQNSWDVIAWNCRGCGFEINRLPKLYHHGDSESLDGLMQHILLSYDYEEIVLIGFSMGGSINTKYIGLQGKNIDSRIKKAINFSTPCRIDASIATLEKRSNRFFKNLFLNRLKYRINLKLKQFPDWVDIRKFEQIETWRDFDEWFTVPMTGVKNPEEFYAIASCSNYLSGVSIPILIVNAKNDPIIPGTCSPVQESKTHPLIYVETPSTGGHVGFSLRKSNVSWMEMRAMDFIEQNE